jgi:hypothetical protein
VNIRPRLPNRTSPLRLPNQGPPLPKHMLALPKHMLALPNQRQRLNRRPRLRHRSRLLRVVKPPKSRRTTAVTGTPTTTADRVTATATSEARKLRGGIAVASIAAAAAILFHSWASSSSGSRAARTGTRVPATRPAGRFGWLQPGPAPDGWRSARIESGGATLFHPAAWKAVTGDKGTVSYSLRDRDGLYLGYLNVTPRQGTERLAGWANFRTGRNRAEGDRLVRERAAAEGLRFADATGSCVVDDYLSRVGSNPYREIACIVTGARQTNVFVGAALRRDWPRLRPVIERAASALLER